MDPRVCGCGKPAVTLLPYSGQRLCAADFLDFTERRVKREVRRQGPYPAGSTVAVAVSGGKDSVALLRLLHGIFAPRRDVRLVAITVDEGIEAYRPPSIAIAREHADALGVEHVVSSYRELAGTTMDDLVPANPDRIPCAMCGPLRRRALNEAARSVGATHLATGHNLDDTAQTVLMNVLRGEIDRMGRMAPHEEAIPGLVPRLNPLRTIPEREVALYAILKGWKFHDGECPYAERANRGRIRDMILDLEEREPGTRHSLLASQARITDLIKATGEPAARLAECAVCGNPSSGIVCGACATAPGRARDAA